MVISGLFTRLRAKLVTFLLSNTCHRSYVLSLLMNFGLEAVPPIIEKLNDILNSGHLNILKPFKCQNLEIFALTGRRAKGEDDFDINLSFPNSGQREKINLNFYFHTSLWNLKRFYEDLKGLCKAF